MTARSGYQPSSDGADVGDRVPLQDRAAAQCAYASSRSAQVNQYAVFGRAADAGNVWVSGLGVGAGSADVQVLDPEWRGTAELARRLFYGRLEVGWTVYRARLVTASQVLR